MTPPWTIALVLVTAILAAVGQLLFKRGAAAVTLDPLSWIANWPLVLGLALHGAGFVLLVVALKHGNLSILYPVLATSYIWVALLSVRYLGEPFNTPQWLGIGFIVVGIALIVR